jgi:hypothetical protein
MEHRIAIDERDLAFNEIQQFIANNYMQTQLTL